MYNREEWRDRELRRDYNLGRVAGPGLIAFGLAGVVSVANIISTPDVDPAAAGLLVGMTTAGSVLSTGLGLWALYGSFQSRSILRRGASSDEETSNDYSG